MEVNLQTPKEFSLLIITPVFPPTTGGAANYYGSLALEISKLELGTPITILTERLDVSTLQINDIHVSRIFPRRAGRGKRGVKDYFSYAFQNLEYLAVLYLVMHRGVTHILVHSSLLYPPNILGPLLILLRPFVSITIDVRDKKFSRFSIWQLVRKFRLITCSEGVGMFVETLLSEQKKLTLTRKMIPLPLDLAQMQEASTRPGGNYWFYAGLVKNEKGVVEAIEIFQKFILEHSQTRPYTFKIAGIIKDSEIQKKYSHDKNIEFLGPISHESVLEHIKGADLCIFLSKSEGLPRFCLESLYLERPILLPKGVYEFGKFFPEYVYGCETFSSLNAQIEFILGHPPVGSYPFEQHNPNNVALETINFIRD